MNSYRAFARYIRKTVDHIYSYHSIHFMNHTGTYCQHFVFIPLVDFEFGFHA